MNQRDRMNQVVAEAARQGFAVRQTRKGTWVFWKGNVTLTFRRTPETPREWIELIGTLRGAGLTYPPED
jgi:hypothetical protein